MQSCGGYGNLTIWLDSMIVCGRLQKDPPRSSRLGRSDLILERATSQVMILGLFGADASWPWWDRLLQQRTDESNQSRIERTACVSYDKAAPAQHAQPTMPISWSALAVFPLGCVRRTPTWREGKNYVRPLDGAVIGAGTSCDVRRLVANALGLGFCEWSERRAS